MTVQTYPGRKPIDWANPPGQNDNVYYDEIAGDGVPIYGSLFAIAALDDLNTKSMEHFGKPVHVIQPGNHKGVSLSAHTHDYDYCMDWRIGLPGDTSVSWLDMQWFGRINGWGCWWRHTGSWSSPSAYHIHGFPLPPNGKTFPVEVGDYVDGGLSQAGHVYATSQIADYWDHSLGLAGQHSSGLDKTPFPKDINSTIFDLGAYIKKQKMEQDMSYEDWTAEGKKQYWTDWQANASQFFTKDMLDLKDKTTGKVKKQVSLQDAIQRDLND